MGRQELTPISNTVMKAFVDVESQVKELNKEGIIPSEHEVEGYILISVMHHISPLERLIPGRFNGIKKQVALLSGIFLEAN